MWTANGAGDINVPAKHAADSINSSHGQSVETVETEDRLHRKRPFLRSGKETKGRFFLAFLSLHKLNQVLGRPEAPFCRCKGVKFRPK